MFDGYIFTPGSLADVEVDGDVVGFEMRTRIPYYRGIPLSMVHDVEVEVDGEPVPAGTSASAPTAVSTGSPWPRWRR